MPGGPPQLCKLWWQNLIRIGIWSDGSNFDEYNSIVLQLCRSISDAKLGLAVYIYFFWIFCEEISLHRPVSFIEWRSNLRVRFTRSSGVGLDFPWIVLRSDSFLNGDFLFTVTHRFELRLVALLRLQHNTSVPLVLRFRTSPSTINSPWFPFSPPSALFPISSSF